MKIFFTILIAITFTACFPEYQYYHSTGGIPNITRANATEMFFSEWGESNYQRFGIAAAIDNDSQTEDLIYYIVIAPPTAGKPEGIDEMNLGRAISISPNEAKELISAMEDILKKWDQNYEKDTGFFYEFNSIAENQIAKLSENVEAYIPIMKFYFETNVDGPRANITFGESLISYSYNLTKKVEVESFLTVLQNAYNILVEKGYKNRN